MQRWNIANPVSTFPLRRFARSDIGRQGKPFLQLTRRHLTLLLFMRRKMGSSSQAGREAERKRKSVPALAPWENITQPCLCSPNSFWFSRKLWAKLQRTNIDQSSASPPHRTASLAKRSPLWTTISVAGGVFFCPSLKMSNSESLSHSNRRLSRNTNAYKELSFNSGFGLNTRAVFSSFWWNSTLRQLGLILIVSIPTGIFLLCLLVC